MRCVVRFFTLTTSVGDQFFGGGGPAGGYCTFECVDTPECEAIDPKSRMFMDFVIACAIAIGALSMAGWRSGGKVVVVTVIAMTAVIGVKALSLYPSTVVAEDGARLWIAKYGADIEVDDNSRAYLRLVPSARNLPRAGSGRPYRIAVTLGTCQDYVTPRSGESAKARVVDWKGGPNPLQGRMCLLEYLPL